MSDGMWRIWEHASEEPAEIEVKLTPFGATEPKWYQDSGSLSFVWEDGRREIRPFGGFSIAEYVPPTRGEA